MNLDKVKEALIMGLNAVESAGWTRSQEKEAQEIREALAELEKPAEDGSRELARIVLGIGMIEAGHDLSRKIGIQSAMDKAGLFIQQYAESYHAKKCAECDHTVWCEFCGDPITIGVCENCVPDMFNDDNIPKHRIDK